MKQMMFELDQLDHDLFVRFFTKLSEGEILKYSSGVLTTSGCSNDFGCCADSIDIDAIVDAIKKTAVFVQV